jgi:spore germination protein KA
MLIQSIEAVNSIRFYRFILIILSSLFGYFGIFLGIITILTNLSDTKSMNKDFLYPFAPINLKEQYDGILRLKNKKRFRNPLLSDNKERGF